MRLTFVVISFAALTAGGAWWWQTHHKAAPQESAISLKEEQKRADALYDSLGTLDFSIREAQETEDSVPQSLVDEQARVWNRYADLRSRMAAEQVDSVHSEDNASSPSILAPTLTFLKQLGIWVWAVVAAILALLLLAFWRIARRKSTAEEEPESFPKPRTLRESLSPWEASATSLEPPASLLPNQPPPVRPFSSAPPPAVAAPPRQEAPLPRRTIDPTFTASSWENTRTTPPSSAVEPSAMQEMILSLSKRGHTPSEIARRLRLPQDQVSLILKLRQAL